MSLPLTPSQTVGPFLTLGLSKQVTAQATGGGIRISGLLVDGAGTPISDGLVETWQAQPRAFTRCPGDDDGRWSALVPAPEAVDGHAPHLAVSVFCRGLLQRLVTRIYLPDNADANAGDPVLARVPAERRGTLVAKRAPGGYRFDIRIQGGAETVFFDV